MPLFPHRVRQWSHALILAICSVFAVALFFSLERWWPELFEPVELRTVDRRFQFRPWIAVSSDPSIEKSDQFVMIDYDDAAADKRGLGRWPWDRRVHAG